VLPRPWVLEGRDDRPLRTGIWARPIGRPLALADLPRRARAGRPPRSAPAERAALLGGGGVCLLCRGVEFGLARSARARSSAHRFVPRAVRQGSGHAGRALAAPRGGARRDDLRRVRRPGRRARARERPALDPVDPPGRQRARVRGRAARAQLGRRGLAERHERAGLLRARRARDPVRRPAARLGAAHRGLRPAAPDLRALRRLHDLPPPGVRVEALGRAVARRRLGARGGDSRHASSSRSSRRPGARARSIRPSSTGSTGSARRPTRPTPSSSSPSG
jgi:hypothetical protein